MNGSDVWRLEESFLPEDLESEGSQGGRTVLGTPGRMIIDLTHSVGLPHVEEATFGPPSSASPS